MKRVVYTDSDGLKWIVDVPDHYSEEEYEKGLVVGPPDLSDLNIHRYKLKKLNHALVDAGLIEPGDLLGRRIELRKILKALQIEEQERPIVSIYQWLYKGEQE